MDPGKSPRVRIGRVLVHACENVAEAGRSLLKRGSRALSSFDRPLDERNNGGDGADFPNCDRPPADIWETARFFIVRLEMAGIKKHDVDVSVLGDVLHIRGERRVSDAGRCRSSHYMESSFGRFERSIPIATRVEADSAEVSWQGEIMTVIIPKKETLPPRTTSDR